MELQKLKDSVKTAAAEAKALVSDESDGRSPFAATIRSNLDHAAEMLDQHEKWIAANPLPKPDKKTATVKA
jgi:hypothetical protein